MRLCRSLPVEEGKVSLREAVCAADIIVVRTVAWQKFAQIGAATGWLRRCLLYGAASCLLSSPCQRYLVGMWVPYLSSGKLGFVTSQAGRTHNCILQFESPQIELCQSRARLHCTRPENIPGLCYRRSNDKLSTPQGRDNSIAGSRRSSHRSY